MIIEINKDIDKYKETVVLGLTARQLIFSVIALVTGGSIVLLTYPYVGLTVSAYIAIPIVAPIALNGFYTYNGMTFTQLMKKKLYFAFMNRPLTYISTEGEDEIRRIRQEELLENKKKSKTSFMFGMNKKKGTQEGN
ncbi:PrgI family protein [Lachnospiraceae bacterium]|nr:PrgI family protein [Lachnospiraceae bacterium]